MIEFENSTPKAAERFISEIIREWKPNHVIYALYDPNRVEERKNAAKLERRVNESSKRGDIAFRDKVLGKTTAEAERIQKDSQLLEYVPLAQQPKVVRYLKIVKDSRRIAHLEFLVGVEEQDDTSIKVLSLKRNLSNVVTDERVRPLGLISIHELSMMQFPFSTSTLGMDDQPIPVVIPSFTQSNEFRIFKLPPILVVSLGKAAEEASRINALQI